MKFKTIATCYQNNVKVEAKFEVQVTATRLEPPTT